MFSFSACQYITGWKWTCSNIRLRFSLWLFQEKTTCQCVSSFIILSILLTQQVLLDIKLNCGLTAMHFLMKGSISFRGTHGYMAPEVLSKGTAYDHSADWFSFGCMLYKLLKGWVNYHVTYMYGYWTKVLYDSAHDIDVFLWVHFYTSFLLLLGLQMIFNL